MDNPCSKTVERATIPGYDGYAGSRDGQIWYLKTGRVVNQSAAGNGARKVNIGKSTRMVHDLIARAFHGRPPAKGYRVKHLNEDLSDNRPENLVWSGSPVSGQLPTVSLEVERAYERAEADRLALVELMM